LVKNLIYRRDNKWVASITKNSGPKTLKELHEEFEKYIDESNLPILTIYLGKNLKKKEEVKNLEKN